MGRIRALICLSTAVIMLTACSHAEPAAGPAAADPGNVAAGITGAVAGQMDVSKLCAAVPQADVQKLFKAGAPAVTANPLECDWGGGGVTVDIYFADPSKHYLSDLFGTSTTQISGLAFMAEWMQPVPDATVPVVGCSNGKTSITISPGLDVDQTTLTYTGTDPFYKIDPASAADYAGNEAAICGDLYRAGA